MRMVSDKAGTLQRVTGSLLYVVWSDHGTVIAKERRYKDR